MEECCLEKLPSQNTKHPCRCPALPQAPCLPSLEKGIPHILPWASLCSTTSHPHPTHRYTNMPERWELVLNWLNIVSHPQTQIKNDLNSAEDGRKVLEKEDLKVLVPGLQKEGASWASLVIAITRSWSQNP